MITKIGLALFGLYVLAQVVGPLPESTKIARQHKDSCDRWKPGTPKAAINRYNQELAKETAKRPRPDAQGPSASLMTTPVADAPKPRPVASKTYIMDVKKMEAAVKANEDAFHEWQAVARSGDLGKIEAASKKLRETSDLIDLVRDGPRTHNPAPPAPARPASR